MKNSIKALVVVAILAIAGMANAQNSASATATANATVICPISIVNTANLEFGTITNSATGGTLVVAPNDATTYTNIAATTGTHAGATPHAASFTVGGQGDFSYSITPSIVTNFAGVGATLSNLSWSIPNSVNDFYIAHPFSSANGDAGSVMPCDLDNDGDAYFQNGTGDDGGCGCVTDLLKVGGTLTLTSAANGVYSATINVAIAYN